MKRPAERLGGLLERIAAASHDLRTPLARLRLRAGTIRDKALRTAIEQDVAEIEAFATSVLDYLRGEEREPETLVDVASIVLTVVDGARDMGGDVDYRGPSRLEAVTCPVGLRRAVMNIVQNALRHAGNARISLSQEAGTIAVVVEDDGPGIPPEALERVFVPFYRMETSRDRGTGGTGLGLPIARRAIERLGGTVGLANRAGGGLEATMRFPVRSDAGGPA